MNYIESKNFLNKEHKEFINKIILSNQFPYFLNKTYPNIELAKDINKLRKKKFNSKQIKNKLNLPNNEIADDLINKSTTNIDYNFLSHIILKRPEQRNNLEYNSPYANIFIEILNSFCKKNKIKYKEIFRIAVNLTFNVGTKRGVIHCDHEFPHRQLLVYLNDCDKNAHTVLLKNNKVYKKIKPEKYKGVCFDRVPHYLEYPKTGERVILVYTFI